MRRRFRLFVEELEARELLSTLLGNQLFPSDNPWNQRITNAPVAANSAALVADIGANSPLHPDFGTTWAGALNGIPYNIVSGTQPAISVVIDAYPDESDLIPIPIPANAVIEGDPLSSAKNTSDRHMIIYDQDHNIVYETYNTHRPSETADGKWHADSEAVWDLNKNTFRTAGFTSADAAGLPILPGLVRPDEVLDQGHIDHALRFTVPSTQDAYVFPASHIAGSGTSSSLPRMGERFRLKESVDISGFSAADQVILQALKDYGMIVADNGSSWYLSGAPSTRWSDDDLHNLTQIVGSDFEAVDLTPIVSSLSAASGTAGNTVTINGLDFSGGAGLTQVHFGNAPATSIQIVSDTQIIAAIPSQAAGTVVDISVVSPYGTSATVSADRFTFVDNGVPAPVVTAILPAAGPLAGGTVVTILGSGLSSTVAVTFGTQAAVTFTVNNDSSVTATAPAQAAGSVDVFVTSTGGTSTASPADEFTYVAPPTAPTLVAPTGSLKSDTPTFSWNAVASADHCSIVIDDVTTGQKAVVANANVTGASWQTTTALVPGHSYRWQLQAVNAGGTSAWSKALSFSIARLAAPTLLGPVGKSAAITPTFLWKPAANADSYSIGISDLTTGHRAVITGTNLTGTNWLTPTALIPGHRYGWWMRSFTSTGAMSAWSAGRTFLATLATPVLTGPAGPTAGATPTLTWNSVAGANRYDVWVVDLTTGRAMLAAANVPGTSWTPTRALTSGHTYGFRVMALSKTGGASLWSSPLDVAIV